MKYFKYLSLVIVIVAILLLVGERYSTENKKVVKQEKLTKADVWKVVNQWRNDAGYDQYVESEELCKIAEARVKEIQVDFSHKGFYNYNTNYIKSENIAKNFTNASFLINDWVNSPTHLDNLKKSYKHSCIAVDNDYVVQIFSNLK